MWTGSAGSPVQSRDCPQVCGFPQEHAACPCYSPLRMIIFSNHPTSHNFGGCYVVKQPKDDKPLNSVRSDTLDTCRNIGPVYRPDVPPGHCREGPLTQPAVACCVHRRPKRPAAVCAALESNTFSVNISVHT
jgi:hypothetical protein